MSNRKVSWKFGLLVLSAIFCFAGRAQSQDLQKVKVALHWNAPNAAFIPYYSAIKQGYYKDQRLDVELLALPGSVPAVTSVINNDAEFGQAGSDAILVGLGNRAPLKVIFLLYQQTPTGVIVFKESGAKSLADLRGKTISTSVASPEGIMLNAKLREIGMDPERDVKILNVAPGAKLTMMLTGQADASTGFINFQYIQAEMAHKQVSFIPFSTTAQPLYGHAVFANANWLEKHQDEAKRFLVATIKGLLWARDNVEQAVDIAVNWDPSLKVDRDFIKRDWQSQISQLITSELTAKQGIGHMEQAGWSNLIKMLSDAGVVTGKIDAAAIYTNALIPADVPKQ